MLFAVFAVPSGFAVASPASSHARTHHSRRRHKRRRRRHASSYQSHPTRARYQQIQQALADKGFLKPDDVDGFWGPKSIDAMERFQAAQKLPNDGNIDALTLTALGLGPKHKSQIPVTAASSPPAKSAPASDASDSAANAQPRQN
ncbi:MAG: peptidoglycan-binding domain-containing protein [Bryobacteraceae bacterium]